MKRENVNVTHLAGLSRFTSSRFRIHLCSSVSICGDIILLALAA